MIIQVMQEAIEGFKAEAFLSMHQRIRTEHPSRAPPSLIRSAPARPGRCARVQ